MIELACPACHQAFAYSLVCPCGFCGFTYDGIPSLIPPGRLYDPVHLAEIERYARIAEAGAAAYDGHAATKPEFRANLVAEMLGGEPFVEVGPGFGELLRATEGERCGVDQCLAMLKGLRDVPGASLVNALADCLPFAGGTVPNLVADSVFQTVPDRERFLCEAWRVLAPGGRFIFSVAFRWNYPRRPQQGFNVLKPEGLRLLMRYLGTFGIGFDVERWDWLSLEQERWVNFPENASYLYIIGRKQ